MLSDAKLLYRTKLVLNSGLLREFNIWKVPVSKHYPNGIKYRLVLVDPIWKKVLLLFDNHAPKGHHWHTIKGIELPYKFKNVQNLIDDFLEIELLMESEYENNEN